MAVADMTPEEEQRARHIDAILRRLGIPVAPRKRSLERRDAGPVMEGDGRTINRNVGSVLRVR